MRVALKIAALVLAVLLVVLSVLGGLRLQREASIVEQELRRDHMILGAAVVEALHRLPASRLDSPDASELLARIEAAEHEIELALERGAADPALHRFDRGDLVTELPVRSGDRALRLVLREGLTERERVLSEGLQDLVRTGLGLLVAGLLAAALGGHRLVGRRLEQLLVRADAIGRGDWVPRPVNPPADEVGALTTALEHLAAHLREAQARADAEQAARLETLRQLRHADRLRLVGDLAAGLAHELGSPLHVIGGNAQLLQRDERLPAEAREIAGDVLDQGERMARLIRRLLQLAHPEPTGRADEPLPDLWADVCATADGLVRDTGVRLDAGPAPDVRVGVTGEHFVQAVANLVRNAAQAQPDGGWVRLSAQVRGNALEVGVEDGGPGVPEELRERVFDPFVTTKPSGEGVGLGLALVRGVVEEAGGSAWVESGLDGGARFVLTLPLAAGAEREAG